MAVIRTFDHSGITGIKVGRYNIADNSTVHIYLSGDTVIDTGPPNDQASVTSLFNNMSASQILLTHHHEDHSGNAGILSQMTNAPVYIHPSGIAPLSNGFSTRMYQKIVWGSARPLLPAPLPSSVITSHGHTLVPVHTPGHSPDHVCFVEPDKKWLFTGDLFLSSRVKMLRADEDLAAHIQSLKSILKLDFTTLFCAHRGMVENGHEIMQVKLDYYLDLVHRVQAMAAEGMTDRDITTALFGKSGLIKLISARHMCSENLVEQCLGVCL